MAGRGGPRPGAGRKPAAVRALIHATPIQAAEGKIRERLPWLVDQMLILAEGFEIQRTDARGRLRIYSAPPDRAAIEYLIDRVLGKPTQPVDVLSTVRIMAQQAGLSDEETLAAVAEAERYVRASKSVTAG